MTKKTLLAVTAAVLLGGCATATYEQQARCAQVGGTPNMFNADLCVPQTAPISSSPTGYSPPTQPSPFDYATGKKPTCTNPSGYGAGC